MKKIFQLAFIAVIVTLTSCEKVVDLDLGSAGPQIVIEGVLTDQPGGNEVWISKTTAYNDTSRFEPVNATSVRIVDESGTVTTLSKKQEGVYASSLTGIPGRQYRLVVTVDGVEYTATSVMPQPVEIAELYATEMGMGEKRSKYVHVAYTDPAASGNYYRFVQYINGVKQKEVHTMNDDLTNGRTTSAMLMNHNTKIKTGDTVRVQLQSIDQPVYRYWYSLGRSASGSGTSATPANPLGNISNGALGYFSAQGVREKTIVVQ